MHMRSPTGVTVLELLLFVGLVFGVVFSLQVLFRANDRSVRDLDRLTDIRNLEGAFARLSIATGSYATAARTGGCVLGGDASTCDFSRIGMDALRWRDPGQGAYIITQAPAETTYEVSFSLEQSYAGLSAGPHVLTHEGIR